MLPSRFGARHASSMSTRLTYCITALVKSTRWHQVLAQAYDVKQRPFVVLTSTQLPRVCTSAHTTPLQHHIVHPPLHRAVNTTTCYNDKHAKPQEATLSTAAAPSITKSGSKSSVHHMARSYKKSMTPNMMRDNRWLVLCKIRIGVWNMIAASLAYMVMPHGNVVGLTLCAIGTLSYASSSLAWNQLNEVEYDKNMIRTRNRPIIKQTISAQQAQVFVASTCALGFAACYAANGLAPALIGLATVLGYVHVYTPMKRTTIYNTEVGALIGAMPVLLGCVAADGWSALYYAQTWVQYGLMFAWQIPHFYTIAWRQRVDYAAAGFKMISYNDLTGATTARAGIKWLVVLWALPFVLDYFGYTTEMFIVCSIFFNLLFTGSYIAFVLHPNKYATMTQYVSYVHILGMLASLNIFSLGKPEWATLAGVRKAGYSYCIHPILMASGIKIDDLPDWLCTHLSIEKKKQLAASQATTGLRDNMNSSISNSQVQT